MFVVQVCRRRGEVEQGLENSYRALARRTGSTRGRRIRVQLKENSAITMVGRSGRRSWISHPAARALSGEQRQARERRSCGFQGLGRLRPTEHQAACIIVDYPFLREKLAVKEVLGFPDGFGSMEKLEGL